MIACHVSISPERQAGAIVDETKDEILPYIFRDHGEATRFLDAAERVGLNIYPGMPKTDLGSFVRLWRDADKR